MYCAHTYPCRTKQKGGKNIVNWAEKIFTPGYAANRPDMNQMYQSGYIIKRLNKQGSLDKATFLRSLELDYKEADSHPTWFTCIWIMIDLYMSESWLICIWIMIDLHLNHDLSVSASESWFISICIWIMIDQNQYLNHDLSVSVSESWFISISIWIMIYLCLNHDWSVSESWFINICIWIMIYQYQYLNHDLSVSVSESWFFSICIWIMIYQYLYMNHDLCVSESWFICIWIMIYLYLNHDWSVSKS